MKGIEISELFYKEYGEPMLKREFGGLFRFLACGLTGSGSECFGYDDEISRDHDFDAGFCIFLPGDSVIDRRSAFLIERAYEKLPAEFMGAKRLSVSPVGGKRRGVFRTAEFFMQKAGTPDGALTAEGWLSVPEHALAEAVNGKVFCDGYGEVTAIRESLREYPADIKNKKLAGYLLLAAQSGQYNYARCIKRGETGAAKLACHEFVQSAMHCCFLLNGRYMPFYKWAFRALHGLDTQIVSAEDLEFILSDASPEPKQEAIERVAAAIAASLGGTPELEKLAYEVNGRISDGNIRNMHILAGV